MAKQPPKKIPVTYAPGATAPTEAPVVASVEEPVVTATPVAPPVEAPVPAPKEAEASFEDKVAAAVAKALAVAMPELIKGMATGQMAIEAVKAQTAHDKLMAEAKAKAALQEKCSICRQVVGNGKGRGCGGPYRRNAKGEYVMEPVLNPDMTPALDEDGKPLMRRIEDAAQFHTKMVVFTGDPLAAEWFPYVKVNGVEYYSAGLNHEIWVPKQNDIAHQLWIYEENERIQRVGRKHIRKNGGTTAAPLPPGAGY